MKTETIEYKDGALNLRGFLAYDEKASGKRPGVIVMPEVFGLTDHARIKAQKLADLGYVALAGDPHGNGTVFEGLQDAMKGAGPLFADPAVARNRMKATFDKLASLPQVDSSRIASIGFCMGGTLSLELARAGAPLKGVVSFHGGLQTQRPAEAGSLKAKLLVCTGAEDPFVPAAQVTAFIEEVTKAKADWRVIIYSGTGHSFTNPDAGKAGVPGVAYNKSADERSWKSMQSFFEEIFGG